VTTTLVPAEQGGPVAVVNDILLFPSCDLHMVQSPATNLVLRVARRTSGTDATQPYQLETLTLGTDCVFDWFRPYDPPGTRLTDQPTLVAGDGKDTTATITRATPGTYLFQIRVGDLQYLVGRLQVHSGVDSWWFGNEIITTVKDPLSTPTNPIAHGQPSLYARFKPDATGVDLVGDITGHGYVSLAPSDPNTFTIAANGRLLGLKEANDPDPKKLPTVSGTWAAVGTNPPPLPVRVVDPAKQNHALVSVRGSSFKDFAGKQNILFLAEGFTKDDQDRFDKAVRQATEDIFTKPRHQPYPALEKSFNVFKVFTPSPQQTVTCGFIVKDTDSVNVKRGTPMPIEGGFGSFTNPDTYSMIGLIGLVGLPRRNEPTDQDAVRRQWMDQGLTADGQLDLHKVSDTMIDEWRVHRADGILSGRDTPFGVLTGTRWGDRDSGVNVPTGRPVLRPTTDNPTDPGTLAFLRRLYEFYTNQNPRPIAAHLDRRRHPPELYTTVSQTNPVTAIARYLGALTFTTTDGTSLPIGQEWAPNDNAFQRSRGHVVILCLDEHALAQNLNNLTITTLSGGNAPIVDFTQTAGKQMIRNPPSNIELDNDEVTSRVAHEVGHSFNLADEYETTDGSGPAAILKATEDSPRDNVTHFNFIKDANDPVKFDPNKVKWTTVPRTFLSSRTVAPTHLETDGLHVPIDRNEVGKWAQLAKATPHLTIALRAIAYVAPPTVQLPLLPAGQLTPLAFVDVNRSGGEVIVNSTATLPKDPIPAGSLLWVPDGGPTGKVQLLAVDSHVLAFLKSSGLPLNSDPRNDVHSDKKDEPVSDIPGFKGPCDSFQVLGVYEGAFQFSARFYRPAGGCKMRDLHDQDDRGGQFCFICKWLITNRVDPGMHAFMNLKLYPEAKTGDDG
jgi:hypothetical protein